MEEPRARRWCLAFLLLLLMLAGLFLWSLNAGSIPLTAGEVWDILIHRDGDYAAVIWKLRLPRTLSAALLGGALSVSGFLLQTFFANPIASPFVLGISSGAKLTVSLAMVGLLSRGVVMSSGGMILAAFAGAMLSMGFVLLLSKWLHQMSLLVVSGVMIGYLCSAVTEFVVTFASDANIVNLHNWSMGSFSGVSWANLRVLLPVIGAALVLLSSVLSASVTAFAGPISFVGIAVPHLAKGLFGTARPILMIPACFLGGAAFCLFCDGLARTVFAPTELSISAVTAVLGAPIVIWIMLRRRLRPGE